MENVINLHKNNDSYVLSQIRRFYKENIPQKIDYSNTEKLIEDYAKIHSFYFAIIDFISYYGLKYKFIYEELGKLRNEIESTISNIYKILKNRIVIPYYKFDNKRMYEQLTLFLNKSGIKDIKVSKKVERDFYILSKVKNILSGDSLITPTRSNLRVVQGGKKD